MTASMSSTSDGIHEASSSPENRTALVKDQYAASSSHRSSYHDRSFSGNDEYRTADQIDGHISHDRAPVDRRVSRSKGFLLDADIRRQSLDGSDARYEGSKRASVRTASSKGKSRANRRSLLGVDVMNIEDEKAKEQDTASHGKASTYEKIQGKHDILANTDQAQIVNLALNLSESRRRHFSSNRIPSVNETSMRLLPKTITSPLLVTPSSIVSQPRQLRSASARSSADIFLSPPNSHSSQASSYSPGRLNLDSNSSPRMFGLSNLEAAEEFSTSEATLLRVQKAKESLELSYEYRRLLQYLPKLPISSNTRSQSGSKGMALTNGESSLGRDYNTLQYIRNRKIRRRQNEPLNAAGQGWKHVEVVRQWIDDVSDERDKRVSSTNGRYPLPQFPPTTSGTDFSSQTADSTLSDSGSVDVLSEETRPRVDWMIEPWNLLADAYWLEHGNNRQLIEDSKSRKIYPSTLSAPIDLRKEAVRASMRRSSSIPRSVRSSNSIVSLESSKQDGVSIKRGRQLHTRHHSIESSRGFSGSRDRKGAWRRFIGSQSPSSTDESVSGTQQARPYRTGQMSTKENQEILILERQIKALMAQRQRIKANSQDNNTKRPFDDQALEGMSSRPSSSGDPSSVSLEKDLSLHLGLVERSREMQPRRFSANLGNGLKHTLDSPSIAINISPPRSRSRGVHHSNKTSIGNAATSLPNCEDDAKLSPKSAHRLRRGSDAGNEFKSRNSKDFESRVQGLLKGTKIIDKVSQPVTKVSNLIWKRDDQSQSRVHSPAASSYDGSDAEDLAALGGMNGNGDSTLQANGQYRAIKLPSFSSPSRGRPRGQSSEIATSNTNTAVSVSDKNGLSASQNLNIETAPASPASQLVQSSEKSSSLPELATENVAVRQRSIQRRHAITRLGGDMTPTNSALAQKQVSWPDKDSLRWLNVTQRLLSPVNRTIHPKDVVALRALTQCTLLTSNNILHQNQDMTYSSKPKNGRSVHAAVRCQILRSTSLLQEILGQNSTIRTSLSTISQTTIPEIHSSLIKIETYILDTMTPIVRTAGDNADKLSAELATTRTLEVKKLNDELDFISRRRRRKFRWLRRSLYWGLEWTLLGLMWWAWLIVVCLRLIRGVFRVTRALVAWLLWL